MIALGREIISTEIPPQDPKDVEYIRKIVENLKIVYGEDVIEKELLKLIEVELKEEEVNIK